MVCTICGRLVTGPALSIHVTAEQAMVHEGRVFRAGDAQVHSDWLICRDCCRESAADTLGDLHLLGFFRVVANDLAKKTGGEA